MDIIVRLNENLKRAESPIDALAMQDAIGEIERLRVALDTLRGRYRIHAGWPHFKWAGHTDIAVLKIADEALGDSTPHNREAD